MLFSKKITTLLILTTLVGMALLIGVNYTDACRLSEVTLNHTPIEKWDDGLGLKSDAPIVRQPIDNLAATLIEASDVFKVDIFYRLPSRIDVRTNNFEPVCFLLDAGSGRLFGLTEQARVVLLDNCDVDWEHPIITSVMAGQVFGLCSDARVGVIVEQLEWLRRDNIDLYRLIDEIDLGYESYVQVALSGLPYRLKVRAENFHKEMNEFVTFVGRFAPDLDGVTSIDMRFDAMIICAGGKS